MRAIRLVLFGAMLILLTAPFASVKFISDSNRMFEEEQQRMIREFGSDEGLYGDCSGVSILLPIFVAAYGIVFFFWGLILQLIARLISRTALLVQAILVGTVGALPVLFWLILVMLRR